MCLNSSADHFLCCSQGTSYHSYLIQDNKKYDYSLSVKWTQNYMMQLQINVFSWELSLSGCRNMCQGKCLASECIHLYLCVWKYSILYQNCSKHKQLLISMGQKSDHFCSVLYFAHKGVCLGLIVGENYRSVVLSY